MRVLITGGAGFVGRWFTKALLEKGHEVLVVDSLVHGGGGITPNKWRIFNPFEYKNFTYVEEDCRDFFRSNDSTQPFDLAIHLAAVVGGRLTIERNPLSVADDLSIDANFWEWAVKHKPAHIVSFSSSAAYPVNLQTDEGHLVLSEEMISFDGSLGMPDMSYGWSKLTNEYLGTIAHEKYGLKVACYRPFSGYGQDQDLSYPFPSICLRALEHKEQNDFVVWGSGLQGRDFIHISDVVAGVLESYQKLTDGKGVNLSTGILTTFKELAAEVLVQLGKKSQITGDESMPSGVFARVGDTTLQNKLGISPKVKLKDGIAEALDFLAPLANKGV
ncbi:NAD-dependent epimerase/dehydratase family protein [Aurantimicrobium minutum]|uniref:NAD-dependent epimerase/dehydratase family protein n=1 Tax=Aurantimicrobium minutum TaxID=708131 RepID=UPI002473A61E|nr:NAD(P)-dependent oxidoreductase [Aurantimicrobium minutum]MDH6239003.1 nucleoside-diphosphate-sugar epimerase [Aurantimicrobium minutum]